MENNIEKKLKEIEHDLEEMEKSLGSYHKANMIALDVMDDPALKAGLRETFHVVEESLIRKISEVRTNINKIRKLKIQEDQITEMISKTEEQQ